MTQTYLIPQYLYDYVYPFTLDPKFHQITYNKNFPNQGQQWLDSVGFDRKYLFYAIKKGHRRLPAICINTYNKKGRNQNSDQTFSKVL